jgi:hypothetical protein
MPLISLMFQHGRTLEEAHRRLETGVHKISGQFGSLVPAGRVGDRSWVKLEGVVGRCAGGPRLDHSFLDRQVSSVTASAQLLRTV